MEWDITFPEWLEVWESSGKLEARGRGNDLYVMARMGDVGPYSPSNVYIATGFENRQDYLMNKKMND